MNKTEFIDGLAAWAGCTKIAAKRATDDVFGYLHDALANGESVDLYGICKFEVFQREPRTARNPRTGETVEVPARKAIKVRLSQSLKDAVSKL